MAPATEQAIVATPFAAAGGRVIASPFQFVTDDDTNLRIVSANAASGVVLSIQGRRLDQKGGLQILNDSHTPNTDRTTKTQDIKLGVGALLNLTIAASAGSPLVGQCYVIVQLIRGFSGAKIVLGTLLAGYVTATQALGFPGSPIVSSTDGEPAVRTIAGTLPAAGVDFSEIVPTGARWELLGLTTQLTTSGAAGLRVPQLQLMSPLNIIAVSPFAGNVGPGLTQVFSWSPGVPSNTIAGVTRWVAPLPYPNRLLAGQQFQGNTVNFAAGDQWTAPTYTVREWLEVNT